MTENKLENIALLVFPLFNDIEEPRQQTGVLSSGSPCLPACVHVCAHALAFFCIF